MHCTKCQCWLSNDPSLTIFNSFEGTVVTKDIIQFILQNFVLSVNTIYFGFVNCSKVCKSYGKQ